MRNKFNPLLESNIQQLPNNLTDIDTRSYNSLTDKPTIPSTFDDLTDGTTNKSYTSTEKTKLSGIATGAEVNVNADWNAVSGDSQILNKPTLGSAAAASTTDFAPALGADDNYVTDAEKTVIGNTSGTNTGDNVEVAAQAVGFTITKGTIPKTLTVALDANVAGTNTGDQDLSGKENVGVAAGLISDHASVITGVHGLVITAGKTITVPDNATISGSNTGDQTAIPNSVLADMIQKTYKGRTTASTGSPEDVGVATLKTDLVLVKGDVGLGSVNNSSTTNGMWESSGGNTSLKTADDVDFQKYKAIAMACDNGATLPSTPATGQWFLHTPTGRKILMMYDGSTWIPMYSVGAMTVYVDGTNGTDSQNNGFGTTTDAFDTIQFAINQIPPIYTGNVIINIAAGTYVENLVVNGKFPSGAYTVTLQGATTTTETGTITSSANNYRMNTAITYAYLDDGGAFTNYTTEANNTTANDVPLMPATEVVNDAFYFGALRRFSHIRINLGTAGVGTAITWEYYNGSTWATLTTTDGTVGFTAVAGTYYVYFVPPASWTANDPGMGVTAFWVRARVSTASFTTVPIVTQIWLGLGYEGVYLADSAKGWTVDTYRGKILYVNNNYYPIRNNTATEILPGASWAAAISGNFNIYTLDTTIQGNGYCITQYIKGLNLKFLILDANNTSGGGVNHNSLGCDTTLVACEVKNSTSYLMRGNGGLFYIYGCYFHDSTGLGMSVTYNANGISQSWINKVGTWGVLTFSSTDVVNFANCLFENSTTYQLYLERGRSQIHYSRFYRGATGGTTGAYCKVQSYLRNIADNYFCGFTTNYTADATTFAAAD